MQELNICIWIQLAACLHACLQGYRKLDSCLENGLQQIINPYLNNLWPVTNLIHSPHDICAQADNEEMESDVDLVTVLKKQPILWNGLSPNVVFHTRSNLSFYFVHTWISHFTVDCSLGFKPTCHHKLFGFYLLLRFVFACFSTLGTSKKRHIHKIKYILQHITSHDGCCPQ